MSITRRLRVFVRSLLYYAFRYADLFLLFVLGGRCVLVSRLPQSEPLSSGGKLLLLWVVGLAFSLPDDRIHGHRLFCCHQDRGHERSKGPAILACAVARNQFLNSRIL